MQGSDFDTSPFFLNFWEINSLKKLIKYFVIFLGCFNLFCLVSFKKYILLSDNSLGKRGIILVTNVSRWMQPFYIVHQTKLLSSEKIIIKSQGKQHKINSFTNENTTKYKFFLNTPEATIKISYNTTNNPITLYAMNPNRNKLIIGLNVTFFIITIISFIATQNISNTHPAILISFTSMTYICIRLFEYVVVVPFLFTRLIAAVQWIFIMNISVKQINQMLFSHDFKINVFMSIIYMNAVLFVVGYFNCLVMFASVLIWGGIHFVMCLNFFTSATTANPDLLVIHICGYLLVDSSILFCSITRGTFNMFDQTVFSDTFDTCSLAIFAMLQILFLMGEPTKAANNVSLGVACHNTKMDKVLKALEAHESHIEEMNEVMFE